MGARYQKTLFSYAHTRTYTSSNRMMIDEQWVQNKIIQHSLIFIRIDWLRSLILHRPTQKNSYKFSFALIFVHWLCKCNAFADHSQTENNMRDSIVSLAVGTYAHNVPRNTLNGSIICIFMHFRISFIAWTKLKLSICICVFTASDRLQMNFVLVRSRSICSVRRMHSILFQQNCQFSCKQLLIDKRQWQLNSCRFSRFAFWF